MNPTHLKPHSPGKILWHGLLRLPGDTWQNLRDRPDTAVGLGLVLSAGISLHWLATSVEKCIESWLEGQHMTSHHLWFTIFCALLAPLLTAYAWGYRHVFRELHVRYKIESSSDPRPFLILFVSLQTVLTKPDQIPPDGAMTLKEDGKEDVVLNRQDPLIDAESLAAAKHRWNWEMLLRGLHPHLRALRRVYLVGSADGSTARGTHHHLETLRRLLAPYLVAAKRADSISIATKMIVPWNDPVDFEDFKAVDDTLNKIRETLLQERTEDHELCVDITGGQKPTSAAAGAFTMNKDVVLQYVQTNPPKRSFMHDVRLIAAPESGH